MELIESGRLIDLVLALVVVEIAALPWLLRKLESPVRLTTLLPNIGAGVALMLAVRVSLTGDAWPWLAAALTAALAAHLLDLYWRLQGK